MRLHKQHDRQITGETKSRTTNLLLGRCRGLSPPPASVRSDWSTKPLNFHGVMFYIRVSVKIAQSVTTRRQAFYVASSRCCVSLHFSLLSFQLSTMPC